MAEGSLPFGNMARAMQKVPGHEVTLHEMGKMVKVFVTMRGP